jgi:hypothetical protein
LVERGCSTGHERWSEVEVLKGGSYTDSLFLPLAEKTSILIEEVTYVTPRHEGVRAYPAPGTEPVFDGRTVSSFFCFPPYERIIVVVEIKLPNFTTGIKEHISRHKVAYSFGSGFIVAGITFCIMRGVASQPISRGIAVTAERGIAVLGKKVVMNNVSYISAHRQGPPSWVVRCLETGHIFSSQNSAALEMGILKSDLSQHLNGVKDHANGFHFERICLAA